MERSRARFWKKLFVIRHSLLGSFVIALLFLNTVEETFALTVSVFDNPSFVDTGGGYSNESDTVQATLASLGHTVSTFSGYTAGDFSTAGAIGDIILFPEFERGNLSSTMTSSARTALASYVSSGGGVIVMGSGYGISLLNTVFGYSMSSGSSSDPWLLNESAAAGTPFEGGPSSVPYHSAIISVQTSSLPDGALDLYGSGSGSTAVLVNGFGQGRIGYLAWDWFNAAPLGSYESGWINTLDSAVNCVPEPSTVFLLGLGSLSLWRRRRR